MRKSLVIASATVSLLAFAAPALAQSAGNDSGNGTSDIIVTARRREEKLQDVPKVVDVVTDAALRNNNIQQFENVANLVPGLNLQDSHDGLVQNASMRGASFDILSGLQSPTIQFYFNDANIHPNYVFEAMYDVGQVEVLRGPQGTLRGRSSPSGAITITSKLPDMERFGGYGEFTELAGNAGGQKYDAALNVPIIPGKLAVRIAGSIDDSDGNGVRSAYPSLYPDGPYSRTWSGRVSIRAKPVDILEINLTYQRLTNRAVSYLQTESTCLIDPSQPCGNGPLISATDRLSTYNGQRFVYQQQNIWNGRVDLHLWGQKLSYVGQYALEHLSDEEPEDGAGYFNTFNNATTTLFLNGVNYAGTANPYQKVSPNRGAFQDHEIRLSSEERIAKIFDYVIGWNTVSQPSNIQVSNVISPHTILPSVIGPAAPSGSSEYAWFGNITAHPTAKLEISAGLRYIIDKYHLDLSPTGLPLIINQRATKTIWSASVSYHFTPDVMAYVNAGSAFRTPGTNLGLEFTPFQVGVYPTASYPSQYLNINPESSTSYEVGIKTQLFDHRLTFNFDYYHQDFQNYQYVSPDTLYTYAAGFNIVALQQGIYVPLGLVAPPIVDGTVNVPAKVDGIEGDINYHFARDGNVGATFSYANGRITGGALVPCNNSTPLGPTNLINSCPGGAMSINPRFSATVHADYAQPITDQFTGFVRGQVTIHGHTAPGFNPYDQAPAYAVANLYMGVRSPTSNWELTLFIKNLFNNQTRLPTYGGNIMAVTAPQASPYGPPSAGGVIGSNYTYVSVVPPRQFGVTVRYAFGSR